MFVTEARIPPRWLQLRNWGHYCQDITDTHISWIEEKPLDYNANLPYLPLKVTVSPVYTVFITLGHHRTRSVFPTQLTSASREECLHTFLQRFRRSTCEPETDRKVLTLYSDQTSPHFSFC